MAKPRHMVFSFFFFDLRGGGGCWSEGSREGERHVAVGGEGIKGGRGVWERGWWWRRKRRKKKRV